jgi:hypothetical protein
MQVLMRSRQRFCGCWIKCQYHCKFHRSTPCSITSIIKNKQIELKERKDFALEPKVELKPCLIAQTRKRNVLGRRLLNEFV